MVSSKRKMMLKKSEKLFVPVQKILTVGGNWRWQYKDLGEGETP